MCEKLEICHLELINETNNNNERIDHMPIVPVNNIQTKHLVHSQQSCYSCVKTQASKLPWNILSLILLIIVIVECVWIVCLYVKLDQIMNHLNAKNSSSHRWENMKDIPQLSTPSIQQKTFDDDKERLSKEYNKMRAVFSKIIFLL